MTTQLHIDTQTQTLSLIKDGQMVRSFLVSTAKNGTGQAEGSGCTPLGKHQISEKFGGGLPNNAVFVARRFTGELYDDKLACEYPERDWILGRILWLDGCEEGINKGCDANGNLVDTKSRYIYIHGTPDTEPMGVPMSHGCVRMRLDDLEKLYNQVDIGCEVVIK